MAQQSTHSPAFVTRLTPEEPKVIITEEELDTMPHDHQPPGTDADDYEPQSLEEALTG